MIELKHLFHAYPQGNTSFEALKDLNFSLPFTPFVAIIGETGSGKTTFTQHINGLLKPTSGEIHVLDTVITSKRREQKKVKFKLLRSQVGMVFQFPEQQLFAPTVVEDVMFSLINFGEKAETARAKALETLRTLEIPEAFDEKAPFVLSGGQKRKVALAGVLTTTPQIVVLDEPFAGLDPKSRDELLHILRAYQSRTNAMMIIVSHDMDLVWELCSKTIVFKKGEIAYYGETNQLFTDDTLLREFSIERPTKLAVQKYIDEIGGTVHE